MPAQMPAIPILTSVQPLAARYRVWLCDVWGVLHNGVASFAAPVAACTTFRAEGGTVVLVTNAPRPAASVAQQLERLGIPPAAYDAIATSGDVARSLIAALGDTPAFHIGPERDLPIFAGLDTQLVPEAEARAIVCTGLFDDVTETPESYASVLTRLRQRELPMICANPDMMVERGGKLVYCAGALAQAYAGIGGTVDYAGKPHAPIYEAALRQAAEARGASVPRHAVLAIGDGLATDIAGAAINGLDALYIASGIHGVGDGMLDRAALSRLFGEGQPRPIAALDQLCW